MTIFLKNILPQKFDPYMKMIKAHDRIWKENQALGYMEKYERVQLSIKVSF